VYVTPSRGTRSIDDDGVITIDGITSSSCEPLLLSIDLRAHGCIKPNTKVTYRFAYSDSRKNMSIFDSDEKEIKGQSVSIYSDENGNVYGRYYIVINGPEKAKNTTLKITGSYTTYNGGEQNSKMVELGWISCSACGSGAPDNSLRSVDSTFSFGDDPLGRSGGYLRVKSETIDNQMLMAPSLSFRYGFTTTKLLVNQDDEFYEDALKKMPKRIKNGRICNDFSYTVTGEEGDRYIESITINQYLDTGVDVTVDPDPSSFFQAVRYVVVPQGDDMFALQVLSSRNQDFSGNDTKEWLYEVVTESCPDLT